MKEDKIQGGIDWKRQRLGKLTASEIYVLMKDRKEPMTEEELAAFKAENPKSRVTTKIVPFSDATFSYLDLKVMEQYLPFDSTDTDMQYLINEYIEQHDISNRAMDHGSFYESVAREKYSQMMGIGVSEVGFIPYDKYPMLAGSSPDGLNDDNLGGVEIKSPFTLEKHMKHFLYKSQDELREEEPQYYWQCVMGMLCTKRQYWDFVSFCPYISESKKMKVLRIHRLDEEINLLENRIDLAVNYINSKKFELDITQTIIK